MSKKIHCRNLDYMCKENGRCIVDVTRRNQCQSCRFKKCLNVNMKKEGETFLERIRIFKSSERGLLKSYLERLIRLPHKTSISETVLPQLLDKWFSVCYSGTWHQTKHFKTDTRCLLQSVKIMEHSP